DDAIGDGQHFGSIGDVVRILPPIAGAIASFRIDFAEIGRTSLRWRTEMRVRLWRAPPPIDDPFAPEGQCDWDGARRHRRLLRLPPPPLLLRGCDGVTGDAALVIDIENENVVRAIRDGDVEHARVRGLLLFGLAKPSA